MKKNITLLCLLASSCLAADVRLAWDRSPDVGVTNYVLYAHTNSSPTTVTNPLVRLHVGTNLSAQLEGLPAGRWTFAATAMKAGVESDPSNLVPYEIPLPPTSLRALAVQYNATLSGTNWQDAGFFRLRIQ